MTSFAINPPAPRLSSGEESIETLEPTHTRLSSTGTAEWESPVTYSEPNSAYFNRQLMKVGRPYPVTLGGVELVAVKNSDDTISFYSIPD